MRWSRRIVATVSRLRHAIRRRRAEQDLDDELAFHLEMQARANARVGLSESEARLRAKRQFGGVEQSKEQCRDVRALGWIEDVARDVQYAMRAFRRSPGFVAVAVLVLALGIGANTTIFTLINAVLFRPLPVPSPDDLRYFHTLWTRRADNLPQAVPYGTFRYLAEHNDVFTGVAQVRFDEMKVGTGLQPMRLLGERVSPNYFDVLQARPALGRTFQAADDEPGANPVLIISDRFWRQVLNGVSDVIGSTVDLRADPGTYYSAYHRTYTVVGVMAPGFNGVADWLGPADYWAPIRQRVADDRDADVVDFGDSNPDPLERAMQATVVARLKPGVTDRQVTPAVLSADRFLHEEDRGDPHYQRENRSLMYGRETGEQAFRGGGRLVPSRLAVALMLVTTLVLLIAATNLTGILMARGVSRRAEIAARLALGAGRARIARQLLTECVLLSLAGSVAAVGIARFFVGLFMRYMPFQAGGRAWLFTGTLDVALDLRALLFTVALGVAAGVLVGLTPALQALKTDVLPVLSGGAGPQATARSRFRRWIVVPQIGLSIVLLLVAGVLVRTLVLAERVDRGLDPQKVLHAAFTPRRPPAAFDTPDGRRAEVGRRRILCARLLEKVRAMPTVQQAAVTNSYWMSSFPTSVVTRAGFGTGESHRAGAAAVSAGYFETMGIRILRGRAFDERDTPTATPVAIVCERLAQRLWPGKEAVGQYIAEYDPTHPGAAPTWLLVVGVAKEVKRPGEEELTAYAFYTPVEQSSHWATHIIVRGRVSAADVKQPVMNAIAEADVDVEITSASTVVEDIDKALYPRRLATVILALAGLAGLLLSSIGLYGIVSYSAAQRVREVGIRAALGADRRHIMALMLREAMVALGLGVVMGVALGAAGIRVVSSQLVGLPPLDALTLVVVPALLCVVILAACLVPARRVARVNPVEVLRGL